MMQLRTILRTLFWTSVLCLVVLFQSGCTNTRYLVEGISADTSVTLPEKMDAMQLPLVELTYPTVYYEGPQWMERMLQLVSEAQDHIILVSFLASECDDNTAIYDMLIEKAQAGVDVWMVIDGTSMFDMTESRFHMRTLQRLRSGGVHLFEYNPISVDRLVGVPMMLFREHRKILQVDEDVVAVGGMNVNYISMTSPNSQAMGQRDMMCDFRSAELSTAIQEDFRTFWNNLSWEEIPQGRFVPPTGYVLDEQTVKAWYVNQTYGSWNMGMLFGSLLSSAKETVHILPFLPYSDANMIQALSDTVQRGVDVTMLLPFDSRPSNRKAIQYMTEALVGTGIDLRRENETDGHLPLLHEKLMVIDGQYSLIGSSNFNFRSMNLANEIVLIVDDTQFASQMLAHFNELEGNTMTVSEEEAAQWKQAGSLVAFLLGFLGG